MELDSIASLIFKTNYLNPITIFVALTSEATTELTTDFTTHIDTTELTTEVSTGN